MGSLLLRGMLVGLVAGLLTFGFARVFGEPPVAQAIGFESAQDEAKPHTHDHGAPAAAEPEPEVFSRKVQAGIGLFTGVMVYSTAFGGLFALGYAALAGRAGRMGPRTLSALLGLAGFVVVFLVPNLKYPSNPPAVGDGDTIGQRTALYFLMIAASLAAAILATWARKRLHRPLGTWNAALVSLAGYAVAVAVAAWLLPAVDEVPGNFPATVLWQFRVASYGMQALMWGTLGLGFGALAERAQLAAPRPAYSLT